MKSFLTFVVCILLCSSTKIQAQTVFAPVGANWYHNMRYGVFHSYYTADTVISGITTRKIVQKAYTANPWLMLGLHVGDHPDLFIYNNTDTVFVYNYLFGKFTPLYVFNVHAGDTVTLPVLPPEPSYMGTITDSFFRFVVDSIKMDTYDTATLKTIYTTPIDPGNPHRYFVYGNDPSHRYAERLGSVYGGIVPGCVRCAVLTTEAIQGQDTVRCYNDPTLSVTLVSGICGSDYSAVSSLTQDEDVSIYPIPATDVLHIAFTKKVGLLHVTLYSAIGSRVFSQDNTNIQQVQINLDNFSSGIYYLKISTDNSGGIIKKVMIVQ